ncbi:MAG: hypothetical protein WBV82_07600 [Myxococcaceae bacterium]
MLNRLLAWIRQNTARAVALAIAPGLLTLAIDAWIEHFVSGSGDLPLQWAPVFYGAAAAVLLGIVVMLRSQAPFAFAARIVGVLGVIVGVSGTTLHLLPLFKDMDGKYDWSTLQGSLGVSPPVFAPLAFAGIGALVFILASPKLQLRYNIGSASTDDAEVVSVQGGQGNRRAG